MESRYLPSAAGTSSFAPTDGTIVDFVLDTTNKLGYDLTSIVAGRGPDLAPVTTDPVKRMTSTYSTLDNRALVPLRSSVFCPPWRTTIRMPIQRR